VNAGYLIIRVILDGGAAGGIAPGGEFEPGTGGRPEGTIGPIGPMIPGGGRGVPGITSQPGPGVGPMPGPGVGGAMMPAGPAKHDPRRSLVVVVPVEENLSIASPFYRGPFMPNTNPSWKPKLHFSHRGQKFVTNLFTDNTTIQWYEQLISTPHALKSRATEIRDRHYNWTKNKTNPQTLFNILVSALEAGMVDEAVAYADELLALAAAKPDGLAPEIAAFAKAYKGMQKGLKAQPNGTVAAETWKARLDAQNVHTQGHYSVISWDASAAEVQRRAVMLEENFRGFFLWHATRGIELQVPETPLLAVLHKSGGNVLGLARAIDVPARLPSDGFYSVEHDILVLSPERLDEVGQTFVRQAQQIYQAGASRTALLEGKGPPIDVNGIKGKTKEDVARMQTIALVDRLVEDNATVATISREGSLQLLYATGRLPRYVELPEWTNHGVANFHTRPKDPAFITNAEGKTSIAVATATGYGGPNYTLQRYFREDYKELLDTLDRKARDGDRAALLKNILTDAYFRGLRDPKDAADPDPVKPTAKGISVTGAGPMSGMVQPPPGPGPMGYGMGQAPGPGGPRGMIPGTGQPGMDVLQPGVQVEEDPATVLRKKRDKLAIKAHATSWALYYYLAKARPTELRTFLDELAALPRDLPLDGDTVLTVFCRSFRTDPSKESLAKFANDWLEYIRTVPPAYVDIPLVDPPPATTSPTGPLGPMGPMGPGPMGIPGRGGPG
jgi:hypothetical protein